VKDPSRVALGRRNKRKGSNRELEVQHLLEAIGWHVTKAGGSLGEWDLVCVHPVLGTRLIQVKSNRCPAAEREALLEFHVAPGVSKEIWIVVDQRPRDKPGERYLVEVL